MGDLIREFDWAATALGAPETWPQSLKTAVDIVAGSPLAMVVLWGPDLIQIYNDAYAEICAAKHPKALGQPTRECWPEVWDFNRPIYEAVRRGEVRMFKGLALTILRSGTSETAWFDLTYSGIGDDEGEIGGVLVTVNETTEQIRRAAEAEAGAIEAARLLALFDLAPGFITVLEGPDHRFGFANQAYRELTGGRELLGLTVREALPEVDGQGFFELLDRVFETGTPQTGIASALTLSRQPGLAPETIYVDFAYQPMLGRDGGVTGIFVAGYDVTARVLAAEHQQMLNDELNHRVKNILATVQALARLTGSPSQSLSEYKEALATRIQAVAKTQNLLFGRRYAPVAVRDLLSNELDPYRGAQVDFHCDDMAISGEGSISLGLLVHELLTNSIKYGALASPAGRLRIRCALGPDGAVLDWKEAAGRPLGKVGPPGFGSKMINRLAGALGGGGHFEILPTGLEARVTFAAHAAQPELGGEH